jgi:hypothetical protein
MNYKIIAPKSITRPYLADGTRNWIFDDFIMMYVALGGWPRIGHDEVLGETVEYAGIKDQRDLPWSVFQQLTAEGCRFERFPVWIKMSEAQFTEAVPAGIEGADEAASWQEWCKDYTPNRFGGSTYILSSARGPFLCCEDIVLLSQDPTVEVLYVHEYHAEREAADPSSWNNVEESDG